MISIKRKTENKGRRAMERRLIKTNSYIYIMLIPVMIYFLVFSYIPMYGLTLAFKTFKPGGMMQFLFGGKFMGLKYFNDIFSDPLFVRALKNNVIISLMKIGIQFPIVIVFSLFLNELQYRKFKNLIQTVTYMPHFFSWVILAGIIKQLLTMDGGVLTHVIASITNIENISPLTEPKAFRWILLASTMYKETGWDTIIFLASMAGINQELYEAGEVDGAGRFKKMWYITIPCLIPTICTLLLLKLSHIASGDFDQVFMLYNTSVYETGDIIETYLYRTGITKGKYSYSTAMGIIKACISGVLLISCNTITKKTLDTGLM